MANIYNFQTLPNISNDIQNGIKYLRERNSILFLFRVKSEIH